MAELTARRDGLRREIRLALTSLEKAQTEAAGKGLLAHELTHVIQQKVMGLQEKIDGLDGQIRMLIRVENVADGPD